MQPKVTGMRGGMSYETNYRAKGSVLHVYVNAISVLCFISGYTCVQHIH
jgi:hypothetical protein